MKPLILFGLAAVSVLLCPMTTCSIAGPSHDGIHARIKSLYEEVLSLQNKEDVSFRGSR